VGEAADLVGAVGVQGLDLGEGEVDRLVHGLPPLSAGWPGGPL
jgi:hypothetical protein